MALLHQATLTPSKLDLVRSWLPTRAWSAGATVIGQVGAYRFDDPAGQVGIETLLLECSGSRILQVPLTYRGAPLSGAEAFLLGTMEHSVLGTRYVYDGCGDPVWAAALARTVLTGGSGAEELLDVGGETRPRQPTVTVQGSGTPDTSVPVLHSLDSEDDGPLTRATIHPLELVLARVVGVEVAAAHTLTGSWEGAAPTVLAGVEVPAP